ncbi:hypothetical protein DSL72_004364 [Monilinia vaccinii-corymbosi]|uniref:Aminoglycoside phosphotransferase domain-containing protein n=1 Tax=Monilinia vaccinii-corymbosi TaxID=61207 RepID=A0A8A3P3M6_9HELO|nr:hypothetical protein DSL72_004364 [Monilinia vaccinii-corymbosi]
MALSCPPLMKNPFPPNNIPAVQAMVALLCEEIKFAKNVQVTQIQGGNKYSIIFFACVMNTTTVKHPDQRDLCVLRTSRTKYQIHAWADFEMGRMAAFQHFALQRLPAPGLLAYDGTYDNHIQCSYRIEQQMNGQNLTEHYRRLRNLHARYTRPEADEAEDYAIVALTVSSIIEHQERAYPFQHYGTFQIGPGTALKGVRHTHTHKRIQLAVKPFIGENIATRAHTKTIDFILALLHAQEPQRRSTVHEYKYHRILDMAVRLKIFGDANHVAHRAEPSTLWHPDFHPRKIILTQQRTFENPLVNTGRPANANADVRRASCAASVLGWDGALALPRIMTRCPPAFLWEVCPRKMSSGCGERIIKTRFDTAMERKLPGYCADAYGEVPRMVRALGMYAILGFDISWTELSFEGLMDAWEKYAAGDQAVVRGRWHAGEYLWGR